MLRTFAAVMLEICAFRPDCLSGAVSAKTLQRRCFQFTL